MEVRILAEDRVIRQTHAARFAQQFDRTGRLPEQCVDCSRCVVNVVRVQERLAASQRPLDQLFRLAELAALGAQQRFATLQPRIVRHQLARSVNSLSPFFQLSSRKGNRGMEEEGPTVGWIAVKGSQMVFLGFIIIPPAHSPLTQQRQARGFVGIGGQCREQPLCGSLQQTEMEKDYGLPDLCGLAARAELKGGAERAQSFAISEMPGWCPEDSSAGAVRFRIVGIKR